MRIKGSLVSMFLTAALPLMANAQTLPSYHVTDLQALPGAAACAPTAINDAGVIAGGCGLSAMYNSGIALWRNGTFTNLGKFPNGHYAAATAMNSFGTLVGNGDLGDFLPHAFVTYNGGLLNIDTTGGANILAIGILDNGVIFGNMTKSGSGSPSSWNPMMWTQDPGHPDRYRENILPKLPGGDTKSVGAYLAASNKSGQLVGWVTNSVIGQLGGFWNNDATHSVVALSALPGGYHSIAWGLNDIGQAVGESSNAATSTVAVLWQNDAAHTPIELGTLPGDSVSAASGINIAGQIVGVSVTSMISGTSRAFFYQNGTMVELASLIDPADGAWTFDSVAGINNAGQIIATGTSNGRSTAVLLTPIAQ